MSSKTQLVNKLDNLLILGWEDVLFHHHLMWYEIDEDGEHSYYYQLSRDDKEEMMETHMLEYIWKEFRTNNSEKERYEKVNEDSDWLIDGIMYGFSDELNNTIGLVDKISEYISKNYKELGLVQKEEE